MLLDIFLIVKVILLIKFDSWSTFLGGFHQNFREQRNRKLIHAHPAAKALAPCLATWIWQLIAMPGWSVLREGNIRTHKYLETCCSPGKGWVLGGSEFV